MVPQQRQSSTRATSSSVPSPERFARDRLSGSRSAPAPKVEETPIPRASGPIHALPRYPGGKRVGAPRINRRDVHAKREPRCLCRKYFNPVQRRQSGRWGQCVFRQSIQNLVADVLSVEQLLPVFERFLRSYLFRSEALEGAAGKGYWYWSSQAVFEFARLASIGSTGIGLSKLPVVGGVRICSSRGQRV
jgi:hypothetical protein